MTESWCNHADALGPSRQQRLSITENLTLPHPKVSSNTEKRIPNYRLSHTRRIVENAFSISVSRWRILPQEIKASVDTTDATVWAWYCFIVTFERAMKNTTITLIAAPLATLTGWTWMDYRLLPRLLPAGGTVSVERGSLGDWDGASGDRPNPR